MPLPHMETTFTARCVQDGRHGRHRDRRPDGSAGANTVNVPRAHIVHSDATQNPTSGLVDPECTNRQFLIQFADMEQVVTARA